MLKSTAVQITTFVNPHLFWFFEKNEEGKRVTFEKNIKKKVQGLHFEKNPQIGQIVLIYDKSIWKRAVVKSIGSNSYTTWLIDYGVIFMANKLYQIPDEFKHQAAFIKQAALNDVVNVKHILSSLEFEVTNTEKFSFGTIKTTKEKIDDAHSIFFDCLIEKDNIHLGEINIIGSDNRLYDLTKILIEERNLTYNKELFEKALEINSKIDDWGVLSFIKSATPCTSMMQRKNLDVFQGVEDILEIKSCGRGILRNRLPKKKSEVSNKKYLENWIEESQKTRQSEELFYESDDESRISEKSRELHDESVNSSDIPNHSSSSVISEANCEVIKEITSSLNKSDNSTNDTVSVCSGVSGKLLANIRKSLELKNKLKTTLSPNAKTPESTSATQASKWEPLPSANSANRLLNLMPAGMSVPAPKKVTKDQTSPHTAPSRSRLYTSRSQSNKGASDNQSFKEMETASSIKSEHINEKMELFMKNICLPGCKCPDCFIATTGDIDDIENNKFIDTQPKKEKVFSKPQLLLRVGETDAELQIKSHVTLTPSMSATERAKAPKLLVHGYALLTPVASIIKAPFHKDICQVLHSFDSAFTIQSYAWPCLMRNFPVCIVNSSKSGKTMAYLPAMCSNLLDRQEKYEELSGKTISPLVIIVCSRSKTAEEVYKTMKKLIEYSFNKPDCVLAVPPVDKQCLNNFQKQCDALVTTPVTLLSLLRSRIITVKRTCHLVLEETDVLLEKFSKEIDSLLNLLQSMLEHRNSADTIQMVISATHWTQRLEHLVKRLNITPVVCIATYLEAALYGRADIKMHFLQSKHKMFTLAEILKDTAKTYKTIVICSNNNEVNEAKEHLDTAGIDTLFVYETLEKQEIMEMEMRWLDSSVGKNLVLICTDQTYNCFINISNGVQLIHYSLPDTWTQFSNRFGCLIDNYASPLTTNKPTNWRPPKVHIFVTETCTKECPKLIQLLLRMNIQLSPAFIECYKKMVKAREKERLSSKVRLCKSVKLFGRCLSDNRQLLLQNTSSEFKSAYVSLNCPKRHILSPEDDYTNNLPKSGLVKLKLLSVKDVTTFNMKILEYSDNDGKMQKWDNHDNLDEELQKTMAERAVTSFDVKLGGLYVLAMNDNTFRRCQVLKVLHYQKHTKLVDSVYVRLLDVGMEMVTSTEHMYELPKAFQTIRAQSIQVHLANMVPPDLDDYWSSQAISKVESILKQADCKNANVFVMGQILLTLCDELWVKNLMFYEKLSTIDLHVTKFNLRKVLQTENLISYSSEQLEGLYNLCKEVNIELPDYDKLTVVTKQFEDNSEKQIEPQWSYLEDCDCNEIYIVCVISPSLFYVHMKKFYDLLINLEKEIQEAVNKPFYPSDFIVEVGKYYLAKDLETENYCRAKVLEIRESIAKCFFVDYGDERWIDVSEIKYLSNEFIAKLPFQAIECRFYGVQPAWDDWDPPASDILRDYIFEPDTDYFRTLYTTACKYEPAETTGGEKCAILLVDNFKENKIILINKLLIDCGEAVTVKNENLQSTFYTPKVREEEVPEDFIDIDDDIEDKELTIEEVKRYAAKYGEDNQSDDKCEKQTNEEDRSETPESDVSWDIVINNADAFLKGLLGIQENDAPNIITNNQFELPPMRALPRPDYSTPDVQWYQTESHIKLSVILPDLNDYKLYISRQRLLLFRANYNQIDYRLDLPLFDKVESTYQHSSCGSYIKVTLNKCTKSEWPRLILAAQKMRNIKYDFSQCSVPEEQKKLISIDIKDDDENSDEDERCLIDLGSEEEDDESDAECDYDD